MSDKINSYKDLIVWQKSMDLVIKVYKATEIFPCEEVYGLTNQARRSAVAIPSNISEGKGRGSRKDFVKFLRISLGSANELQTQLEIAKRLNYLKDNIIFEIDELLTEIIKMLNVLIYKLLQSPNI